MTVRGQKDARQPDFFSCSECNQVSKLEDCISNSASQPRFQTLLLTCFAAIALLLAAVGLYGLSRIWWWSGTLEIGVRMTLGAKKAGALRMIIRHGLMLTLIGLGAGLVSSAIITRLLSGLLYEIQPSDAVTFAVTTGVLLLVSLAASTIPAYRAAQMEPIETLGEQ